MLDQNGGVLWRDPEWKTRTGAASRVPHANSGVRGGHVSLAAWHLQYEERRLGGTRRLGGADPRGEQGGAIGTSSAG
jgi:hypothetical protein